MHTQENLKKYIKQLRASGEHQEELKIAESFYEREYGYVSEV